MLSRRGLLKCLFKPFKVVILNSVCREVGVTKSTLFNIATLLRKLKHALTADKKPYLIYL